ncbi:outer membrane protein OmpA [Minicystis rosea]|nr:outer membrane protein OmpA [Minicystis rosea]
MFRSRCSAGALAGALVLAGATARAQGLPLDRFEPAPAGDRMFGVPSPFVAGHLTPHAGLLLEYAHNPLVLSRINNGENVGTVLSSQMFLHVNASFALWNRLSINLDLPIALLQAGDSPSAGGSTFPSPNKAQVGDLRAGLRVRLFGDYHDAFQLGLGGYVYIPTGPSDGYVGTGKVRGAAHLLLGGRTDRIVWSLAAGPQISGTTTFSGVTQGTMINAGFGLGVLLGEKRHFQIGPEAYASFTVVKDAQATSDALRRTANVEVLLDARYRVIDDLELALGAGPGLTAGVGTPDFRGVFMIAYTPEQKKVVTPGDRDGDGILDNVDACPDLKGIPSEDPKKNGCPPPAEDRDGDGILDKDDACPDVKGIPSDDPKKHGCPPPPLDTDGDGIPDTADACPLVKGPSDPDPKKNGCPDTDGDGIIDAEDACRDVKGPPNPDPKKNGCPDTDGDGIVDPLDACPTEAGPPDPNPKKNGCPVVHVTEGEIVILEQVQFDTGKSTIKPISNELLDKVAAVFKAHAEIIKVEVQGHTDNKGIKFANKQLSQARADAVLKALVKRGIEKKRLVAKGYGQDVPIADNANEAGRQENRRVQFKIVEKKPKAKP